MKREASIPQDVLDKIIAHRPHLAGIAANIPHIPAQAEKALADAYLNGESRLSVIETAALAACCVGKPYGAK